MTKTPVDKEIAEELEDEGIPRAGRDGQDIPLTGDEAIFKHIVITPEHPVQYVTDKEGTVYETPKLTRTIALGNLTADQMIAAEYYLSIANTLQRISQQCPGCNYASIVNRYYLKVVQMCTVSQAEGGKLLTMAMTEQHHYGIRRINEEQEVEQQSQNPIAAIHEKIMGAANRQKEIAQKYGR